MENLVCSNSFYTFDFKSCLLISYIPIELIIQIYIHHFKIDSAELSIVQSTYKYEYIRKLLN